MIPSHAEVSDQKLDYLLKYRATNDKSHFLGIYGFTAKAPGALRAAILQSCIGRPAHPSRQTPEGWNFVVETNLEDGGRRPVVRFVWSFRDDGRVALVTLYPGTTGGRTSRESPDGE